MKRLHVHVAVPDLGKSIAFYTTLFGAEPVKVKTDYAKWMLDDPRVNFAISRRGRAPGIDHVGVQVDTRAELDEIANRLKAAGQSTFEEEAVNCCYAQGDKSWVSDPSGVRWETFHTFGDATIYGEDHAETEAAGARCGATACGAEPAAPSTTSAAACCS